MVKINYLVCFVFFFLWIMKDKMRKICFLCFGVFFIFSEKKCLKLMSGLFRCFFQIMDFLSIVNDALCSEGRCLNVFRLCLDKRAVHFVGLMIEKKSHILCTSCANQSFSHTT